LQYYWKHVSRPGIRWL